MVGALALLLVGGALLTGLATGEGGVATRVREGLARTAQTVSGSDPGAEGEFDGSVSVDADIPALTGLDPDLYDALRAAEVDAAADGVEIRVTSGWRSRAYQQRLLDRAVEKYGSREEAERWVATPEDSSHVTGDAVDVGPTDAAYYLSQHGAAHGLCQTFAHEIWHYELRETPDGTCPPPAWS